MSDLPTDQNLPNPSLDQEIDQAIWSVEEIQAELNYKQAQDALRDLVKNLDLTPQ